MLYESVIRVSEATGGEACDCAPQRELAAGPELAFHTTILTHARRGAIVGCRRPSRDAWAKCVSR